MSFFDLKEEVMDLQLTQHGKNLLSRGKFSPSFYAFFDDDIIYDASYAGVNEIQNKAEDRIQNKSVRPRAQYVFKGIEENISKLTLSDNTATDNFATFDLDPNVENEYCLGLPIGDSSLSSEAAPAWNMEFLHGKIDSLSDFLSTSAVTPVQIPQLNVSVEYKTYITSADSETGEIKKDYIPENLRVLADQELAESSLGEGEDVMTTISDAVLQVIPDFSLIDIFEENSDYEVENFDIEVFVLEENEDSNNNTIQTQKQLSFYGLSDTNDPLDNNYVEYYFNLEVDKDIPDDYFCAAQINSDKKKNMRIDGIREFDCPDLSDARDLYDKKLEKIEDC